MSKPWSGSPEFQLQDTVCFFGTLLLFKLPSVKAVDSEHASLGSGLELIQSPIGQFMESQNETRRENLSENSYTATQNSV